MEAESLESVQKRHRQELKELQGRITSKKKNASKKTRKGVNDECAELERQLREKQAAELAALGGAAPGDGGEDDEDEKEANGAGELEQATEKLQISPPAAEGQASPAAAAASAAGSGGKKRNRQKERLARRAAEQEAASERAEEEAANMTDHRARESVYMKKMFESNGLVEQEIAPDGHCLFSAMADQLGQYDVPLEDGEGDASTSTGTGTGTGTVTGTSSGEPRFKTVRRAAAAFMQAHADDFAPFLDEDLEAYVAKMRDTAEWGGQLELTALARRYESEIRVIQDGRTERIGEDEGRASGRTLWLAYYRHGYGLGEHYNSLRKTAKAAT
jgi:OTU domain-containing protein 6